MRLILLHNVTAILLKKCDRILLQNASGLYYKMRQLLQIATILLQNTTVMTKCDLYHKLQQYNSVYQKTNQ